MDIELQNGIVVITEEKQVPIADFIAQKQLELKAVEQDMEKCIQRQNDLLEQLSQLIS